MLRIIIFIRLLFCFLLPVTLTAQEVLKSIEEEYYDFLALQGLTERPTLNYRTLSDSWYNIFHEFGYVGMDIVLYVKKNLLKEINIPIEQMKQKFNAARVQIHHTITKDFGYEQYRQKLLQIIEEK
jgi:hypothetical protein